MHRYCVGITSIFLLVAAGQDKIVYEMIDISVDMNGYVDCQGVWRSSNKDVNQKFVMSKDKIGSYWCTNPEENVYIFAVDQFLTFSAVSENRDEVVSGENVTLLCSVTVHGPPEAMFCEMKILNETNVVAFKNFERIAYSTFSLSVNTSVLIHANQRFRCSWDYYMFRNSIKVANRSEREYFIRAFIPPKHVNINEKTIKINDDGVINAQVNQSVECTSEADPPSLNSWSCNNSHWIGINASIIFTSGGIYSCTCFAKNLIGGRYYNDSWNGIIQVITKEEYEQINPCKLHLCPAQIVGIVTGALCGVLLVAGLVYALVKFTSRNPKKMKVSKKIKDINQAKRTSPEAESFQVDDNQLYGKL